MHLKQELNKIIM